MIRADKQGTDYWALFFTCEETDPLRQRLGHYECGLFFPDRYVKECGVDAQRLTKIVEIVSDLARQRG
jgi:hypothetical protein